MAIESVPTPITTQDHPKETWVFVRPDGAHIVTHPTTEQLNEAVYGKRVRPLTDRELDSLRHQLRQRLGHPALPRHVIEETVEKVSKFRK